MHAAPVPSRHKMPPAIQTMRQSSSYAGAFVTAKYMEPHGVCEFPDVEQDGPPAQTPAA